MNKIRFLMFIITIIVFSCICVSAETPVTTNKAFDNIQNGIVVSGTVQSVKSNPTVTLEMKNPSNTTVYVDDTVVVEGKYEFAPIKLHPNNQTGNYTIIVTVEDIGVAAPITHYFAGATEQLAALVAVNGAAANEKCSVICDKADDLGITISDYNNLKADGLTTVKNYFSDKSYSVPAGTSTDANLEILIDSINEFRNDYKDAIYTAKFNDISDSGDLSKWLTDCEDIISTDNPLTTLLNEVEMYNFVKDTFSEAGVLQKVVKYPLATDPAEAAELMLQAAALTIVETHHYTEIMSLYNTFHNVFGINTSKLQQVSKSRLAALYEDAKGTYSSFDEAGEAFNALVEEVLEETKGAGGGSSGGNTGGTTGGGTIVAPSINDGAAQKPNTNSGVDMPFPDMGSAVWANQAVSVLKEKEIVCGDNYGNFKPQDYVKRSEFIKMVVLSLNLDLTNSTDGFADVSSDNWCYKYVNAAKAGGLIVGNGDNCFRPDDFITRQDMAVILYRAYAVEENENYVPLFVDSNEISEYAKKAVAYFNRMGIINGVGENRFAPLHNATRAEAAQMMFNAFMK